MVPDQSLPETLPAEPLALAAAWLAEARARRDQPNPDAMVLATCSEGRPSARVVLCKGIDAASGAVRFVSNYESRKGQELAANPRAALLFHWDHLQSADAHGRGGAEGAGRRKRQLLHLTPPGQPAGAPMRARKAHR